LGIYFFQDRLISDHAKNGAVVPREMEGDDFVRENYVVWHENKFLTKAMQAFLGMVKAQGKGGKG
ncbi:MAG: substrate-binding domain-containing protein, partial [Lachnospiraceae bacterium]|nr:substrate-binding domain-containing protein [Lachnospiraceae bacterium]